MDRIYLDHAATTPLHPEAREAMLHWLNVPVKPSTSGEAEGYGNPSSLHADGRAARQAVDQARESLSDAMSCLFAEVIFTSSGTEAANLAIIGAALANEDESRKRVLFGAVEHHCVLHCQPLLEKLGYLVELIPVDRFGQIKLEALKDLMGEDVLLVAVMHANNEIGTFQPVQEVAEISHRHGAVYFCDAVQTFLTPDFSTSNCADLVSVAAHKVNGPKAVGALRVRAGTKLKPISMGGGQERELRAGTENVAGIAGFAAAVNALRSDHEGEARKCLARDAFLDALLSAAPAGLLLTLGEGKNCLGGHAHLRFEGLSAETMLIVLDRMGVSASSGAACSSGSLEPSHVLLACGYTEAEAKEGLRFTFGRASTVEEAEDAMQRVLAAVSQVRAGKA